jgi:hypothetical protein
MSETALIFLFLCQLAEKFAVLKDGLTHTMPDGHVCYALRNSKHQSG